MKKYSKIIDELSDLTCRELLSWLNLAEKERLNFLREEYGISMFDKKKIVACVEAAENSFDRKKAYREFRKQIRKPRNMSGRITLWGSIAAASIVIFLGIWQGIKESSLPLECEAMNQIEPGRSMAVVTMAGGKRIRLERNSLQVREEDGTMLHVAEGKLTYSPTSEDTISLLNTLNVPRGGEYNLILSDGTEVWLNAETEITFPVKFSGNFREIALKGEAYFEVRSDSLHPFIVKTSKGKIRVLGTSFNVRDYGNENETVTTLVSGKVLYSSKITNEEKLTLLPGFQVVDRGEGQPELRKVDLLFYTGWRDGKYVFEDTSLEDIMNTLERWYDIEVFYVTLEVKKLRFTGDLERYKSISIFLNLIETGGDVKFNVKGKKVWIEKK